jgi:hypothetical protein
MKIVASYQLPVAGFVCFPAQFKGYLLHEKNTACFSNDGPGIPGTTAKKSFQLKRSFRLADLRDRKMVCRKR